LEILTKSYRIKRLTELVWLAEIALVLSIINNLWIEDSAAPLMIMVASVLSLPFIILLANNNYLKIASSAFIYYLWLMLTLLAWQGQGLHDSALIAYPGLFILIAILGKRKMFLTLIFLVFFSLLFLGGLDHLGLMESQQNVSAISVTIDMVVINTVLAISIWVLSTDIRNLVLRVKKENVRTRKAKDKAQHLANHDSLTQLANRAMAKQLLIQALSRNNRDSNILALMFVDIDYFKHINDSLGHDAGDAVLKVIANRLSASVRITDNVCRQGGDEFLLIVEGLKSETQAASLAAKILSNLSEIITVGVNDIVVTCSIGITLSPNDAADSKELLKNADVAMYHAKETGRNCVKFFDEEMNNKLNDYVSLASDMRKAIKNNEFRVNYQAKIEFDKNAIVGAEALIRWQHETLNNIPPEKFIPVAENSGLILEMGEWVLNQACDDCKSWHNKGLTNLSVAVNVSAIQFKRGNVPDLIYNTLKKHKLDGRFLEIELTESLLLENDDQLNNALRKINEMGVHISIDDFGTGYSNLAYLKRFAIGCLKIDQSFVKDLMLDKQSQSLVHAIIQLSKSLGLYTIAEGVEDEATKLCLCEMGCDFGQGFLWSRAVSSEDFSEMVKQQLQL